MKKPVVHEPTRIFFVLAHDPNQPAFKYLMGDRALVTAALNEHVEGIEIGVKCDKLKCNDPSILRAARIKWGDPINPVTLVLNQAICKGLVDRYLAQPSGNVVDYRDLGLKQRPQPRPAQTTLVKK